MRPNRGLSCSAAILIVLSAASVWAQSQKAPIQITADLSDVPRKLYHAEIDLPVIAGPLTLTTPKWIPGEHRPTGPADSITGVVFTAIIDGKAQPLAWRRDDVDLYQFHLTIPKGVTTLHAHLDCIVTARVTQKIAVLEWEKLLLYPANMPVRDIPIQPSLIVPAGWGIGTALTPIGSGAYPIPVSGSTTHFAATNVEQLQDSPIIAGQYFHEFALAPEILGGLLWVYEGMTQYLGNVLAARFLRCLPRISTTSPDATGVRRKTRRLQQASFAAAIRHGPTGSADRTITRKANSSGSMPTPSSAK
jgi:predicted metalloprotease with PDZ domain